MASTLHFSRIHAFLKSKIWQVVAAMREMVNKDTQNLVSNSFLLDDDLRYGKYFQTVDALLGQIFANVEQTRVVCYFALTSDACLLQCTILYRGSVHGYPGNGLC